MTENEVARAHSTCRYTGAWRPAGGCDRPSRGLVAFRPPARLPPPQRLPVGYPFLVAIQRETTCSPWTLRARSRRGEFGAKEIGTRPALKPAAQAARWTQGAHPWRTSTWADRSVPLCSAPRSQSLGRHRRSPRPARHLRPKRARMRQAARSRHPMPRPRPAALPAASYQRLVLSTRAWSHPRPRARRGPCRS
jgi:hypothetical protein